jgi:hypothetical protein
MPAALDEVKELTTAYLTVTFKDKDGAQVAPSSILWRLDDVATDGQIVGDTVIAAAAQIEIQLDATYNAIINAANKRERKRVTVKATYGAGDTLNDEFLYRVINLTKVP